jgi:hypothetical protein
MLVVKLAILLYHVAAGEGIYVVTGILQGTTLLQA